MAFMEMLRGAWDPPVSTQLPWAEVALQLQGDPRYEAVAEEQRVQMYETFLEALAKVEASKLQRRTEQAAADFKVGPMCWMHLIACMYPGSRTVPKCLLG